MVFPKALPFARLTFGKTFTHGYTQSVIAVSQPWNTQQPFQNRFQKFFSHHALSSHNKPAKDAGADSSFADYLREWQKIQKLGARHWRQYQFARRLEWQPREDGEAEVADPDGKELQVELDGSRSRTPAQEAYSDAARDEALATLDTITDRPESELEASPALNFESSPESEYVEHMTKLAASGRYDQIPAVFQAMVDAGVKPTVPSYHPLMQAAIHMRDHPDEVVKRVLRVYSDMLQQNLIPDMAIFNITVEVVARQALLVASDMAKLEVHRERYGGLDQASAYLFSSTEFRATSLAKDDSMTVAVRLFDDAQSNHPNKPLSERTYRVLIAACAEHELIKDMTKVYYHMDRLGVTPHADTFIRMIPALAKIPDMPNAVGTYSEYKRLAMANDSHEIQMVRMDQDVYAALVKAYAIFGDDEGCERFLEKLKDTVGSEYPALVNAIGLKSLLPVWLSDGLFEKAFCHIRDHLTGTARDTGFAAVCIKAADRGNAAIATEAFNSLSAKADISDPALALSAMHIRMGNLQAADELRAMSAKPDMLEMVAMRSIALILSGNAHYAFQEVRAAFANMRSRSLCEPSDIRPNRRRR